VTGTRLGQRYPVRRSERIISNTYLDSQGERLTRECLESLVTGIRDRYVPITVEHDPRIPPQGRIVSGTVRQLPDGEFEAVATCEMFDEKDNAGAPDDRRELIIEGYPAQGLTVSYGWPHRSAQDQADIDEIAQSLGNPAHYVVKKSLDPISVIVIGGSFVLGQLFVGFLNAAGADAWKLVKQRLTRLTAKAKEHSGERLLVFTAVVDTEQGPVEVDTILTNPMLLNIELFLEISTRILDHDVPRLLEENPQVRKLVFESSHGDLSLRYAVRWDCVPLVPGRKPGVLVEAPGQSQPRKPGVSPGLRPARKRKGSS
jgi:hypothetical protein